MRVRNGKGEKRRMRLHLMLWEKRMEGRRRGEAAGIGWRTERKKYETEICLKN